MPDKACYPGFQAAEEAVAPDTVQRTLVVRRRATVYADIVVSSGRAAMCCGAVLAWTASEQVRG